MAEANALKRFQRKVKSRLKLAELDVRAKLGSAQIRSGYGPLLTANFQDATFRLYVKAAYGYFYWDRLAAIDYPFVFLDIGANQGLYTLGAARNPYLDHGYAFEPVPDVAELLDRNVALNGASAKCTVTCKAISDRCADVAIATREGHSGGASIAPANSMGSASGDIVIETIDAAILSQIIADSPLPIVMKVDVEGHEEVVIREVLKCDFADRISEIFYEVDERWVDPTALEDLLGGAGFRTQVVGTGQHYDVLATR